MYASHAHREHGGANTRPRVAFPALKVAPSLHDAVAALAARVVPIEPGGHVVVIRGVHPSGWARITVGGKAWSAAKIAWFIEHAAFPSSPVFRTCSQPRCIRHLALNNPRRRPRRVTVPHTKLDATAVRAIRRGRARGVRTAVLAQRYHVSPFTIYAVLAGRTWSHVA